MAAPVGLPDSARPGAVRPVQEDKLDIPEPPPEVLVEEQETEPVEKAFVESSEPETAPVEEKVVEAVEPEAAPAEKEVVEATEPVTMPIEEEVKEITEPESVLEVAGPADRPGVVRPAQEDKLDVPATPDDV
ncbi:MAG TPA: hypothetical protein VJ981_07515, partial [Gammaproteobacteria bacterium]|nr:hypothetical protein [Gammaproteobacteria bacterium]